MSDVPFSDPHGDSDDPITQTGTAWADPVYDAAGNMVSGPQAGAEGTRVHYVFDAWNRLVAVKADAGGGAAGSSLAEYRYDGLGRKISGGWDANHDGTLDSFTHYYYTGSQMIETRDASSLATAPQSLAPHYQYVWSARGVDTPICRDRYDSAGDFQSRYYYLSDANGNVTAMIAPSGAVAERYGYDPYGKVSYYTSSWGTRTASFYTNTVLYAGRELDTTTGLYYNRARWYHPTLGTFVSRDPLGLAAGGNMYAYCGSNPISRTDSSGLDWGDVYSQNTVGYGGADLRDPTNTGGAVWDTGGGFGDGYSDHFYRNPWSTLSGAASGSVAPPVNVAPGPSAWSYHLLAEPAGGQAPGIGTGPGQNRGIEVRPRDPLGIFGPPSDSPGISGKITGPGYDLGGDVSLLDLSASIFGRWQNGVASGQGRIVWRDHYVDAAGNFHGGGWHIEGSGHFDPDGRWGGEISVSIDEWASGRIHFEDHGGYIVVKRDTGNGLVVIGTINGRGGGAIGIGISGKTADGSSVDINGGIYGGRQRPDLFVPGGSLLPYDGRDWGLYFRFQVTDPDRRGFSYTQGRYGGRGGENEIFFGRGWNLGGQPQGDNRRD